MTAHSMAGRSFGVVVGVVADVDDPLRLARVRVRFPHLGDQQSAWARLATLMAGRERGTLFRPEPGDEVLVGFLHGDVEHPYILGALWNERDLPPEGGGPSANHLRALHTRSGHILRFSDEPGAERVELIASGGKQRVVIDVAAKRVTVAADEGDVAVSAGGAVTVDAGTTVTVKATTGIRLEAPEITVEASGVLTLKGGTVRIN